MHHFVNETKMPNNLVFILVFMQLCAWWTERKSLSFSPHQSINGPSNLSHLEFHANGLVGKKAQTSTRYTHGCSHNNVLSLLPLDIILQRVWGSASANHRKQFPLSLSLSQCCPHYVSTFSGAMNKESS